MSVVVFRIDRRSGVATYLQIVRQVEQALGWAHGRRPDRLPTAAQVAATTKVNPNTTLKAYRQLTRALPPDGSPRRTQVKSFSHVGRVAETAG